MRIPYRGAGVVFLKREGRKIFVFLGKRSKRPFSGLWAVPGGGFEKSKDSGDFDCACRETLEETAIDLKKLINLDKCSVLGEHEIKAPFFSWRSFFCLVYDSHEFSNAVADEFSKLEWKNINEIDRITLRPFTKLEINRALRLCKDLRWRKNA